MEKAKKIRAVQRTAMTKALNALEEKLGEFNADRREVLVMLKLLEDKMSQLDETSNQIFNLMIDENATDEEFLVESNVADGYKTRYLSLKLRVTGLTTDKDETTVNTGDRKKKTYKLPIIEIAKFSGNVREWFQFWTQFKKIHENNEITNDDKFQYLLQAMIPGSRACDLVNSFPATGDNYEKAIKSLKNRYGKDEIIIEVYVRELLTLVLQKVLKPNEKISLASLYDKLESQLRALETLGVTTDKCAAMLFPLVESALPEELLRAWQRKSAAGGNLENKDRLTLLMEFVQSEVESEERIQMAVKGFTMTSVHASDDRQKRSSSKNEHARNTPTAIGLLTKSSGDARCIFCDAAHESERCEVARKMTMVEKRNIIMKRRCCFNCLRGGHSYRQCRVNVRCAWCAKRHVVLMCPEICKEKAPTEKVIDTITQSDAPAAAHNLATVSTRPFVYMSTLRVVMRSDKGSRIVRALLDTGAQRSYVLADVAKEMGLVPLKEEAIEHSLFGGVKPAVERHNIYLVYLQNMATDYLCNFQAADQSKICDDVPCIDCKGWSRELENANVTLHDTGSGVEPISILIGADIAGKLMTGRKYELRNGLTALETFLGWTIMGKLYGQAERVDAVMTTIAMHVKEADISDLWKLDVIGINDPAQRAPQREREQKAKDDFLRSVHRDANGRYEVSMTWKEDHAPLPTNKNIARRRLDRTTEKLKADGYYQQYDKVLSDWLTEGIIEKVPDNEVSRFGHYLPHRHVVKHNSTTKLRPVFDASAREKGYPSLNECLETGPNIIEMIPAVLIQFRKNHIGVMADIKRAFLQISLCERDRDFLRFLWWDKDGTEPQIYRHTRVVFGVSCSPFLLGAVLALHMDEAMESAQSEQRRDVVRKLKQAFYVDNFVSSVSNAEELQYIIKESKSIMSSGCFDLRGWEYSGDKNGTRAAVLGLVWDKVQDSLSVNTKALNEIGDQHKVTKRTILAAAQRIYDPIGFTCPITLYPKLILQKMWKRDIGWDSDVESAVKEEFLKWMEGLTLLKEIQIPRNFGCAGATSVSLHTFCDASQVAYATAVFLRAETPQGVRVQLVGAKSRVAPIKPMTIPRLELLAATVGARLTKFLIKALDFENIQVNLWTDSTTALAWIQREAQWSTFVWNRVQEIHTLTESGSWRHVPGSMNPADLPSRGCTVQQLIDARWWEGPRWLRQPETEWPLSNFVTDDAEVQTEVKKSATVVALSGERLLHAGHSGSDSKFVEPWYARYASRYHELVRFIGWALRFVHNSRTTRDQRRGGELDANELKKAETRLWMVVQRESFDGSQDPRLSTLCTYVDKDGLIRVKTKIFNRIDTYGFRCPIIADPRHIITRALIRSTHERMCHAGVQTLMTHLRENYWVLSARRGIRAVVAKCVTCKKQTVKRMETMTPPLPEDRVKDAAVFEVTGVDLAGPLVLSDGRKAWICLYTCAVYRAVHLELLSSASTKEFLESLRRFVARRGRPSVVYSDNGTNFVGANNIFRRINWGAIARYSGTEKIDWRFNPPSAAWWGGWWERLIGILKRLLRRVLGRASLSYEEMNTVLCDCEMVMNSRPLTYASTDLDSLSPLTPSMFLQEIRQIGVPDCDASDRKGLQKRLRYKQQLRDELRTRFRNEYLGSLQLGSKIKSNVRGVKVGDVVLIGSDNRKRLDWPLARVVETIVGRDGNVRVLRLRTSSGELARPVQRVYPLELQDDSSLNVTHAAPGGDDETVTRSGRVSRKPDRLVVGRR